MQRKRRRDFVAHIRTHGLQVVAAPIEDLEQSGEYIIHLSYLHSPLPFFITKNHLTLWELSRMWML